jgi:hypothetical protein
VEPLGNQQPQNPSANVAIVHDDEWCAVIEEVRTVLVVLCAKFDGLSTPMIHRMTQSLQKDQSFSDESTRNINPKRRLVGVFVNFQLNLS